MDQARSKDDPSSLLAQQLGLLKKCKKGGRRRECSRRSRHESVGAFSFRRRLFLDASLINIKQAACARARGDSRCRIFLLWNLVPAAGGGAAAGVPLSVLHIPNAPSPRGGDLSLIEYASAISTGGGCYRTGFRRGPRRKPSLPRRQRRRRRRRLPLPSLSSLLLLAPWKGSRDQRPPQEESNFCTRTRGGHSKRLRPRKTTHTVQQPVHARPCVDASGCWRERDNSSLPPCRSSGHRRYVRSAHAASSSSFSFSSSFSSASSFSSSSFSCSSRSFFIPRRPLVLPPPFVYLRIPSRGGADSSRAFAYILNRGPCVFCQNSYCRPDVPPHPCG